MFKVFEGYLMNIDKVVITLLDENVSSMSSFVKISGLKEGKFTILYGSSYETFSSDSIEFDVDEKHLFEAILVEFSSEFDAMRYQIDLFG